ncbi:phage replisome organizer N-terminal domain-containing protein [uncultured Veillonella sp.]|uniref:phage replisome organizer N-terminal domain-containing protein n=1 Tax=uncultured Veillonella sp. TaxID=159268 RepID=UPI00262D8253|nr:phage replisome organizer N-terminal domain-containing protein [uncultured Veillonella sp.]
MAEPKRYYWLRLHKDFFQKKEIKRLRRVAGGDTYTIIYLKMLLRSIIDGGKLYFDGYEDTFVSELALDIDEDEQNVQITVNYLLKNGLLIECENDEYYLPEANNNTGSETAAASRMRKHREKSKDLECNNVTQLCNNVIPMLQECSQSLQTCYGEIEKEKELYKEIHKELEHRDITTTREDKEIENSQSLAPMSNTDIYNLWISLFGLISSFVKGKLDDLIDEYGLVNVADAVRIAKEKGKSRIGYVEGILKNQRLENGTNGCSGSNRAATRKDEQVNWEQEAAKTYGKD